MRSSFVVPFAFRGAVFGLGLAGLFQGSSRAAVTSLDSFSDGPFEIGTLFPLGNSREEITSDVVEQRFAVGSGASVWSASVSSVTGLFSYSVDLRSVSPTSSFGLSYSRPIGTFSLLSYDAFRLTVVDVVGSGRLHVIFAGVPEDGAPLPIDGPGEYAYPFSNIGIGPPLDQLSSVTFWLFPESTDFSITIDQIAVVPEPGAEILALLGLAAFSVRRRRSRGTTGRSRSPN